MREIRVAISKRMRMAPAKPAAAIVRHYPDGAMSSAPPSGAGAGRSLTIIFESGRRMAPDALRLTPNGAVLEVDGFLREPLRLTLGQLQIGLVERGPAKVRGAAGRFPVLKRLSASAVLPREQGIEGWLWTSTGGSALTTLGDPEDAPNAALLFTKPLGEDAVSCFVPTAAEEIAARSPLGAPAIYGLLFRVTDTVKAENTFRQFGLLRPVTDREVPPTLRRALPSDRPADPKLVTGDDARSATSVAPPGLG